MIKFNTQSGNWSIGEPTIESYYKIQDWLAFADQADTQVRLISLLSSAPEEEIREMDGNRFAKLWDEVAQGPLSAVNVSEFKNVIEFDNVQYKFITLSNLTIGELADLDTLKNHDLSSKQLHKMIAVLYRPMKADGTIEPHVTEGYEERAELFLKRMHISYVKAAIDFFFHITKISSNNMLDSLIPRITETMKGLTKAQKKEVNKKLQEAGLDLSTFLPEMTF